MKVCIIDDEWICRFITQKLIEKTKVDTHVSQFTNGQEAFEFISDKCFEPWCLPELIFLDINMPVANGWMFLDMLQKLSATDYNPSIYITSSSQDEADMARARSYPEVSGYISKPITPVVLEKVFQDLQKVHA